MKRFISVAAMVMILLSSVITCFATNSSNETKHNVCAKYNYYSNENMYTADCEDGKYTVKTDDGITVIVIPEKENGLTLVVHRITEEEKEAYDWFKKCIPEKIAEFIPFDIFYVTETGERKELSPGTEIKISETEDCGKVLGVSYEEKITYIDSEKAEKFISFKTVNESNYYVIYGEKAEKPEKPEKPNVPDSGDTAAPLIAAGAIFASAVVALALRKRCCK